MPLPLGDLSNRRSATPARVPTGKKVGFAHPNHTHSIPRPRAQSYTAPEPRLELTDFELLKKIGQGGFGEVRVPIYGVIVLFLALSFVLVTFLESFSGLF